jgi:uncharacterized membrane protein YfcA
MTLVLAVAFFLIAVLYAAVGSGGGSGYLAAMSLAGLTPEVMRPTALILNILVTSISTWKFVRAGHFAPRLFWPIAAMSIPFAFLGGRTELPGAIYRPLVGAILFYAAFRLIRSTFGNPLPAVRPLPFILALLAGASIGFVSGLVGVGGGIFLSPLALLAGWATTRQALGITAAFVLVNSAAGLLGFLSQGSTIPDGIAVWIIVVAFGGWLGAEFGSQRLNPVLLRRLLAFVLIIGGLRMMIN